ncbi:MAG: flippase-like domain-containing protein [Magnetovibrio sp.]|nr:flippase-like domain-containing protein [Magnetovibrio sp.]
MRQLIKWGIPIVGTAAMIAVLFWIYRDLDVGSFGAALKHANPFWLSLLAFTILLEQYLRGWKWRQILYDLKPISSFRLCGAIFAGYGAAILVPLGISPLVRAYLIARLENLRMASVLTTSAIERFIDGVVFALIAALVAFGGWIPHIEGDVRTAIAVAGVVNFIIFSALLWVMFHGRTPLSRDEVWLSRAIDWLSAKAKGHLDNLRESIRTGIIWPHSRSRQGGVIGAAILMKAVAASHFLWAGLAVGVVLDPMDYVFLMVFAGFAMVIGRFIRVPGGFLLGAGFALDQLGVASEPALAMILLNYTFTIILMVGVGLVFLWRSGVDIRSHIRTLAGAKDHDTA